MVRIGPAFFDYVSKPESRRKFERTNLNFGEFKGLLPLVLLILMTGVIVARLFYLQMIRGSYYRDLSENNRTRTKVIPAPRGIIYDRNGKPLVSNSHVFQIGSKGEEKIIPHEEALKLISEGKQVRATVRREYLYKDAFAHVLGFLGQISENEVILPTFSDYAISDYVGKMGLEKTYEKMLHGQNGKELLEVDVQGREIRSLGQQEAAQGQNLDTALDLDLQLSVKDALASVDRGAAIASDPRDGSIIALYSKPSFDPNMFSRAGYKTDRYVTVENILQDTENQPLLNRAISGTYPPGSTFKLITAVAALSRGAIKKDTQIVDTGILRVGEFSFGNWYFLQYGKTEGALDVVSAIKRSNDIFFYRAAEGAGVENISSFAKNFGLGLRMGIDIEGESEGIVPSPSWKEEYIGEQWYLGDTYNYGIGQGYLLTTPLQVNLFTGFFANGGKLYRPHLLKTENIKPKTKNFIKKEYIDLVREGMRQSCDTGGVAWPLFGFKVKNERLPVDGQDFIEEASGSARSVRIRVACKTGTAEVSDKEKKPHAWITVFAPFYDPEIVLTVLVENGGEGSSVAGPIAKKILQEYFERK